MYYFLFGKIFRVFSHFKDHFFNFSCFFVALNINKIILYSPFYLFVSFYFLSSKFLLINKLLTSYSPFLKNVFFKCLSLIFSYFVFFFCYLIQFSYIDPEQFFGTQVRFIYLLEYILFLFLTFLLNALPILWISEYSKIFDYFLKLSLVSFINDFLLFLLF